MPKVSGSKMMMYDREMPKGMHKMPGGMMMKNSAMRKKKKSKYAEMLGKGR